MLALALAGAPLAAAPAGDLVVSARRAHDGEGAVIPDARVLVRDGRIASVLRDGALPDASWSSARAITCDELLPGLVAAVTPAPAPGPESVEPERRATDARVEADDDALLRRGVTALAISPGASRLVPGRGGIARLGAAAASRPRTSDGAPRAEGSRPSTARVTSTRDGALHAVLTEEALSPPLLFEPVLRVNADNPLEPAKPQRPGTTLASVAELRRLMSLDAPPWSDVRAGRVALRLRARTEPELRRALALAKDFGMAPILEGADEAWRLAPELAQARALVVVEPGDPARARAERIEARDDLAALLEVAGVRVALADPGSPRPDPLLLAASAVRRGMTPEGAIAAVTGRLAGSEGGSLEGRIVAGAPADLVGFDGDPLATRPAFVVADGRVREEDREARERDDEDAPLLALRVGRALSGGREVEDATIVVRGERIVSVMPGDAPAAATVRDLGPGSVAVPGFIDAFSRAGIDAGPPPGGTPRVLARDALEPEHPSFADALRAGVTSGLAIPATRGSVLGAPSLVGFGPRREEITDETGARIEGRPVVDVLATGGLVLWLDDGPDDDAPRAPRLKAFKELVTKARGYHDAMTRAEKKPDDDAKSRPAPDAPDPDRQLDPFRSVFAGKSRMYLRSGREDLMIAGIEALKASGVTPVLCGAEEADLVADELASRGVTVVLRPVLTRRDGREVDVAATLRARGVPVAFGSFEPGAASRLPLEVAALVREGLAPADGIAGLTSSAAAVASQDATLGRLEPGARADIVVFDGDPMQPRSRVILVVARGRALDATSGRPVEPGATLAEAP